MNFKSTKLKVILSIIVGIIMVGFLLYLHFTCNKNYAKEISDYNLQYQEGDYLIAPVPPTCITERSISYLLKH